jgi:hypothetical protein
MTEMLPAVPQQVEDARALPSAALYLLERAGELAREVLDERITEWTQAGWTQRQIAEEIGCDHTARSADARRVSASERRTRAVATAL